MKGAVRFWRRRESVAACSLNEGVCLKLDRRGREHAEEYVGLASQAVGILSGSRPCCKSEYLRQSAQVEPKLGEEKRTRIAKFRSNLKAAE
jgi:hypothetical protein